MTGGGLETLRSDLERLDGKGYGSYRRVEGTRWALPHSAALHIERVQSDPFAPPSRLAVTVPPREAALPAGLRDSATRRRALADHLARLAVTELDGGGRSPFRVDVRGQQVLERTTCQVGDDGAVRLRLGIELPADGRRVRGREAARRLCEDLPRAIAAALRWEAIDHHAARRAVECVEDTVALREQLPGLGLIAFVGDGAVLPRRSGIDDRPLEGAGVVAFEAPPSLAVEVDLPHRGRVRGLGIPEGVTLVVGGGFHGKSTLLRALERGVYDHVPGDGRELVATRADAVKVRAEDGRRVARVDVSAFVGDLPTGADTADFSTDNASGSTSQAAAIVEALEAGAGVLLVDEDTAATNLMIRDQRMQALVAKEREPLTPFVDVVQSLHRDHGVSTVLVVGGSGDYFDVADQVLLMDAFRPHEVTADAHQVARSLPGRRSESTGFPAVRHRVPDPDSIDPRVRGRVKTRGRGTDALRLGASEIDLGAVEQLVDPSQTTGIAQALVRLVDDGGLDGERTLAEVLDLLDALVEREGLDVVRGEYPGDLARPRRFEVAAALNRLRTLRVRELR